MFQSRYWASRYFSSRYWGPAPTIPYTSAGPRSGSATANIADTGFAWTNPSSALIEDGNHATTSPPTGQFPDWLEVTGFGFSVPLTATILGILVEVKCRSGNNNCYQGVYAQLRSGGSNAGTADYSLVNITTTDTYYSVGGTALWGAIWTPTQINATDFGVLIRSFAISGSPQTFQVDFVRITIQYSVKGQTQTVSMSMGVRI